ncbi:MAG: hypothetical protein K9M07_07700 [Simkaniaceae bacterium]|nr:hypothetical protein [Simkaniaceae bacterium]
MAASVSSPTPIDPREQLLAEIKEKSDPHVSSTLYNFMINSLTLIDHRIGQEKN